MHRIYNVLEPNRSVIGRLKIETDLIVCNGFNSIRYANRFESIRFEKKSAFRFTSCHAVFALNK